MTILVIQGPNLNMLGHRDPRLYGLMKLEEIHSNMRSFVNTQEDVNLEFFHSNFEGEIIDKLQECVGGEYDGVIMNPGGLCHYSISLADAIMVCGLPVVEVHLSNIHAREIERRTSLTASFSFGIISGFGPLGYHLALTAIIHIIKELASAKDQQEKNQQ